MYRNDFYNFYCLLPPKSQDTNRLRPIHASVSSLNSSSAMMKLFSLIEWTEANCADI